MPVSTIYKFSYANTRPFTIAPPQQHKRKQPLLNNH